MGNWIRRLKEERVGDWKKLAPASSQRTAIVIPDDDVPVGPRELAAFLKPIEDKDQYGDKTFASHVRGNYVGGDLPPDTKYLCEHLLDSLKPGKWLIDEVLWGYLDHRQRMLDAANLGRFRVMHV